MLFDTENDDIILPDTSLIFSSSVAEQCFTVEVVTDEFVEDRETVTLRLLAANNESISLSPETTVIIINNDDSKIYCINPKSWSTENIPCVAALPVEFTQVEYVVDEEELVANVCITAATDILHRNVSINVTTTEDSAKGLHV